MIVLVVFFVAAMVNHQQFVISEPDEVHNQSRPANLATVSTSCSKQVCTHGTLWRQHYITTNSHILSKYFELEFLQLHLVKILCKLIIIWLIYDRKKKGIFYETPCILCPISFSSYVIRFCWFLVEICIPKALWNKHMITLHNAPHLVLYVRIILCKKS